MVGGHYFNRAISLPGADVAATNALSGIYPALTFVLCVVFLGESWSSTKVLGVFFAFLSGICFMR